MQIAKTPSSRSDLGVSAINLGSLCISSFLSFDPFPFIVERKEGGEGRVISDSNLNNLLYSYGRRLLPLTSTLSIQANDGTEGRENKALGSESLYPSGGPKAWEMMTPSENFLQHVND